MQNSDSNHTTLYLAADEMMQIHLLCNRMKASHKDEFTFAVRTFCYMETDNIYAKNVLLKLFVTLHKEGLGMSLAVDLSNVQNVFPIQLKGIIEQIQKSPALLQAICQQLDQIAAANNIEEAAQAKQAKQFFIENAPKGITSFTTSRHADKMYWLTNQNHIISNLGPFKMDDKGGHIAFSVHIGFQHEFMMQCYEVECMMHLFNDEDKLGYFFELYLDQENFHHQLMYDTLPDQFMDNKEFLKQILAQMQKRNEEQYDDNLQDLIEKFTASI